MHIRVIAHTSLCYKRIGCNKQGQGLPPSFFNTGMTGGVTLLHVDEGHHWQLYNSCLSTAACYRSTFFIASYELHVYFVNVLQAVLTCSIIITLSLESMDPEGSRKGILVLLQCQAPGYAGGRGGECSSVGSQWQLLSR